MGVNTVPEHPCPECRPDADLLGAVFGVPAIKRPPILHMLGRPAAFPQASGRKSLRVQCGPAIPLGPHIKTGRSGCMSVEPQRPVSKQSL